jgi:hypothetical protein
MELESARYSLRNAIIGSTRAARHAGAALAPKAATARAVAAVT